MANHPRTCTCAECDAPTAFLNLGYQTPDCVWAQPEADRSPNNTSDFSELGSRRFIRGLLPVKLAKGDEFRYGVWLEVDIDTFGNVRAGWDDDERYPTLRFTARIANAAPPWRETLLGVEVGEVGVRDPTGRPFVVASTRLWLQKLLRDGWSMPEYEAFAALFRP